MVDFDDAVTKIFGCGRWCDHFVAAKQPELNASFSEAKREFNCSSASDLMAKLGVMWSKCSAVKLGVDQHDGEVSW
jgi:hypothetical protein